MTNPFALDTPATAPALATAPATSPAPTTNPFGSYGPTDATRALTTAAGVPSGAPVSAPDVDPFSGPAPQQPRGPRLRDLYGRLLLVIPHKLEENIPSRFKNPDGSVQMQDRMTADVIVLDGGPVHYGGTPEKVPPVPHDKVAQVPHKSPRMFISNVGLISQCRDALAKRITQGQPGMVLGRLAKGEETGKGEPPWLLTPYTPEDAAIARQYLSTVDPFA